MMRSNDLGIELPAAPQAPSLQLQGWPSRAESRGSDSRLDDSAKTSDSRLGDSATLAFSGP